MKWLRVPDPVTGGLAAGCVVLIGVILRGLWGPPFAASQDSAAVARPGSPDVSGVRRWTMPPAAEFSVIVQRPLFTPGRQPPARNEAQGTVTPPPELPALSLGAVVSGQGRRLALIERDGDVLLMSEGDGIEGWILDEIHDEHVVLNAGGRTERVYLKDIAKDKPSVGTPVAPSGVATRNPGAAGHGGGDAYREIVIDGRVVEVSPEDAEALLGGHLR